MLKPTEVWQLAKGLLRKGEYTLGKDSCPQVRKGNQNADAAKRPSLKGIRRETPAAKTTSI